MNKMWMMKLGVVLTLIGYGLSAEAKTCDSTQSVTETLVSTQATASVWANLQNKPGSIKRESKKLLEKAFTSMETAQQPVGLKCNDSCQAKPMVALSSIPMKFLSDPKKLDQCQPHLTATQKKPLIFTPKDFPSLSALQSWMTDFSQGKGDEGKQLYQQCPGDCSPQFYYDIDLIEKKYQVRAEVVCGMPRDKKDGMYTLEVSHQWQCVSNSGA